MTSPDLGINEVRKDIGYVPTNPETNAKLRLAMLALEGSGVSPKALSNQSSETVANPPERLSTPKEGIAHILAIRETNGINSQRFRQ